ncbi:MAG: PHP domain-containing protein [Cyanophyceae cyanobacterium]
MIDLHAHTTCSDGSLSPTALVELAAQEGLKALAISDHDTTAGWVEACTAGDRVGVEIVPALELSTVCRGRSLHILGFYPDAAKLADPLEEQRQGRIQRAQAMVDKLATLGFPIELPVTHLTPGRPHLAQALVKAGHVRNNREAFDRLLGDDGPAFVPFGKFSALDGIQLLRDCDAIPVWAHPHLFRGDTVERTLRDLVAAGLRGIEVYHPEQSKSTTQGLAALARKYDLVWTGGSDYHGPNARGIRLNMLKLDPALLDQLKTARFG